MIIRVTVIEFLLCSPVSYLLARHQTCSLLWKSQYSAAPWAMDKRGAEKSFQFISLSIYAASPSLLSIMHRAAWGGGKPGHISAFPKPPRPEGDSQTTIHIHSDRFFFLFHFFFFFFFFFVLGWTRTRTEEVCSSVVKYSTSTDWAIPAPYFHIVLPASTVLLLKAGFDYAVAGKE